MRQMDMTYDSGAWRHMDIISGVLQRQVWAGFDCPCWVEGEHTDWAIPRDKVGSIVNLAMPHIGGRGSKAVAVHLADPCLSTGLLD